MNALVSSYEKSFAQILYISTFSRKLDYKRIYVQNINTFYKELFNLDTKV